MARYTIYTDGACIGNPGPGGWAAIVRDNETGKVVEISGGEADTTNNRMEITGLLKGLRACKEPESADVYSDSQYVCNSFEKGWLSKWVRNGWVSSSGKPVLNQDLWNEVITEAGRVGVKMHWVKGHSGDKLNERCDELASSQAKRFMYKGNLKDDMPVDVLPFEKKRIENEKNFTL